MPDPTLSRGDTSGRSVDHGWREQGWVELRCPRCGRTAYGPVGNTFCGWHAPDLVLMEAVLTAKGPER